jgi:hypothetical protein
VCNVVNVFLDTASSGSESMYAMMKSVPGGNMPGVRMTNDAIWTVSNK